MPELNEKIDVLDHGFVRLVDVMGSDLSVSRAARVSYAASWRAGYDEGSDAKLIKSLWRRKHSTPFESVEFQFEVKAPIFVLRQWHRHRTWTYNELSARYKEVADEFYIPAPELIGIQSKSSKQGRDIDRIDYIGERFNQVEIVRRVAKSQFNLYELLLNEGWPRELARTVLPLSTYSHMFAKVNLLNLLKFLQLRCAPDAQYEIRVYADAMKELIRPFVPVCLEAFEST